MHHSSNKGESNACDTHGIVPAPLNAVSLVTGNGASQLSPIASLGHTPLVVGNLASADDPTINDVGHLL